MSYASHSTPIVRNLTHRHTWRSDDGTICSSLTIGGLHLVFESAGDARALARHCADAAAAMDALAGELAVTG